LKCKNNIAEYHILKDSDKGGLRRNCRKILLYYSQAAEAWIGFAPHFGDGGSIIPVMEATKDCSNVQESACYSF
jgi:hypothetical protein